MDNKLGMWVDMRPITFTNGGTAVTFVSYDEYDLDALREAEEDRRRGRTIKDKDLRRKHEGG